MADRSLKGNKSLKSLAPDQKQKPGGNAGPDSKIRGARLLSVTGTKLMEGMSSFRGKGGHK